MDGYTYFGSINYVIQNQYDVQLSHDNNNLNCKKVIVNVFIIPARN